LPLRRSGCPVFCFRQAAAAKKQENRPLKTPKNLFYIALPAYFEQGASKTIKIIKGKKNQAKSDRPTLPLVLFYFRCPF
jgi:hypothetical protein